MLAFKYTTLRIKMENLITSVIEKNQNKVFDCIDNKSVVNENIESVLKDVKNLEQILEQAQTVGEKTKVLSAISKLKSFIQFMIGLKGNEKQGTSLQNINTSEQPSTSYNSLNNGKYLVWEELPSSAFSQRIRTVVITNLIYQDLKEFLKECIALMIEKFEEILKEYVSIKVNTIFCGEFKKPVADSDDTQTDFKHLNTKNVIIYKDDDLREILNDGIAQPLLAKFDDFQEKDSGWALSAIINLVININKYVPITGCSFIRTPSDILRKKAVINVKNNGNACFAWAVVSALYPTERNSDRPSSYPHYEMVLNLDNIKFPMELDKIHIFENNNNISINVFAYHQEENKKKEICPLRLSKFVEKGEL